MADRFASMLKQSRQHSFSQGILPGLFPLFVVIGALILLYLYGACEYDLDLILQELAVALWGIGMLLGLTGLFFRRWRVLAISLLLALVVSALVVWPLVFLYVRFVPSAPVPFCRFNNG